MKIRKFLSKTSQLVTDPVYAFPKARRLVSQSTRRMADGLYHNTYDYLNNSPHIISYPKAGRTWLRIMLNLVFADLTLDQAVNVFELERIKRRLPKLVFTHGDYRNPCLLYTSPSPRDRTRSRMPSSA